MMTDKLFRLTFVLIFIIGIIAFALSFSALRDIAGANGQPGWRSWLWPALIDLPLIVFSLVMLWSTLNQKRTGWGWAWIAYAIATAVFNVAHGSPGWLGFAVAIVPPLTFFLCVEAGLSMVRTAIELRQHEPEIVRPVVAEPKREPERTESEPTDYKTAIFAALDEQPERTTTELAELVGCAKSTASKWANKYTNGHA